MVIDQEIVNIRRLRYRVRSSHYGGAYNNELSLKFWYVLHIIYSPGRPSQLYCMWVVIGGALSSLERYLLSFVLDRCLWLN